MVLGSEQLGLSVRIATVVVPVAVYFLILGLLNSRRHPQMLTGRLDFVLMFAALGPVFILPTVEYMSLSPLGTVALVLVVAAGIALLAPRGGTWVVYNLQSSEARSAVVRALGALGVDFEATRLGLRLGEPGATVSIRSFSLLRNVSIGLRGGDKDLSRRFQAELSRTLGVMDAETSPAAMSFLLVATALLVAPLSLVAHRVPEIVRILTDLL